MRTNQASPALAGTWTIVSGTTVAAQGRAACCRLLRRGAARTAWKCSVEVRGLPLPAAFKRQPGSGCSSPYATSEGCASQLRALSRSVCAGRRDPQARGTGQRTHQRCGPPRRLHLVHSVHQRASPGGLAKFGQGHPNFCLRSGLKVCALPPQRPPDRPRAAVLPLKRVGRRGRRPRCGRPKKSLQTTLRARRAYFRR